jgi:hypothetical protein
MVGATHASEAATGRPYDLSARHTIGRILRRIMTHCWWSGVLILTASSATADIGTWVANSDFAQINVFCTRVYKCVPAEDILHSSDSKVVTTDPVLVRGVCSAGDGPADGCNVCLTNNPTSACEWHLEPK